MVYWFRATLSRTLERAVRREIGQLLFGSSRSPSLMFGTISALFHSLGKEQHSKELFTMSVIEVRICGRHCLITLMGTLSNPSALFDGINKIALAQASLG